MRLKLSDLKPKPMLTAAERRRLAIAQRILGRPWRVRPLFVAKSERVGNALGTALLELHARLVNTIPAQADELFELAVNADDMAIALAARAAAPIDQLTNRALAPLVAWALRTRLALSDRIEFEVTLVEWRHQPMYSTVRVGG